MLESIKLLDNKGEGASGLLAETMSLMRESGSRIRPFTPSTPNKCNVGASLLTVFVQLSCCYRRVLAGARDDIPETHAESEGAKNQPNSNSWKG